jgi:hypothetical protein
MSDIFREVDEDVRSDKLAEFWSKYSIFVIGLALAIVLGAAAYSYLRHQKQVEAEAASSLYQSAQILAAQGKTDAAVAGFDALAKSAPRGYALLARLRAAEELAANDQAKAVAALDLLAEDAGVDPLWRDLARLRAGLVRVDVAEKAEIEKRFGPLLNSSYRFTAREFMALAAIKRGDFEDAGKLLDQIVVDPTAPQGLRQRAQGLLSLVRGGGKAAPAPQAPPAR